jgi:hypothetical protein
LVLCQQAAEIFAYCTVFREGGIFAYITFACINHPGPQSEHAILVDRSGNVWLSGAGRCDSVQKFTNDGKLLWGTALTAAQRAKVAAGASGADLLAIVAPATE